MSEDIGRELHLEHEATNDAAQAEQAQLEAWEDKARELGREQGNAAGSWVCDGSTTTEAARKLIQGYEDGDPVVMDIEPSSPLSGEWADSMTPCDLFEGATGLDAHAEASWNQDAYLALVDDLCDAYEEGFTDGFWQEAIKSAKVYAQEVDE